MQRSGYPLRLIVTFAAALSLAALWLVVPLAPALAWPLSALIVLGALLVIGWRTHRLAQARAHSAQVLDALGAATADVPVNLRTRMPLVLVTGDALPALFNHDGSKQRLVFIGDGALWVRVERARDLPRVALAMLQWRDGHAPDGVVLSVAPALYDDEDALAQSLRVARQALADASRMTSARLPAYVAVYQRLTRLSPSDDTAAAQWYGVSAGAPIVEAERFEAVLQRAEAAARRQAVDPYAAAHAAGLASLVGWTQRVIFGTLTDPRQPAAPWPLHGAGWIDCGPATSAQKAWERDMHSRTRIAPAEVAASPAPWPLPQPLIEAMPRRARVSPRLAALGHAIAIAALALAAASWGSAQNNTALLARIDANLERFKAIPSDHDAARRDALKDLVSDRDELDRYARTGVPLRISFGLYHGTKLIPELNAAIASYQPPPPPSEVITLDSMSLFDSGKAQLKPGSNRALVGALERIKAHPDKRVLVAGYTDNAGDARSNLALSMARAAALRDWLIDASGIAATQFAIQGYGDTRPIASNDTPEGRAANRRVEITLVPDTSK